MAEDQLVPSASNDLTLATTCLKINDDGAYHVAQMKRVRVKAATSLLTSPPFRHRQPQDLLLEEILYLISTVILVLQRYPP